MSFKEYIAHIFSNHRWTITLVALAIVLFILIVTLNFWRTLLLCVIVGVCYFIGRMADKGGWSMVKSFFDRILPK